MSVDKVLLVDDSPAQLENLRRIVADAGYRTITATSGVEAVRLAKQEQPDVILMDIVMDDLDGYGACRQILSDEQCGEPTVVFVSTKNNRADEIWARKQGAVALISKPYDDSQILGELGKY